MRGWSSIFVGLLLLGVTYWWYSAEGINSSTLICAAAAAFCFFRGAQGLAVNEIGDASTVIDFVTDPREAIVDTATDRIADWLSDNTSQDAEEQPKFDPDAAIARYLAERGTEPAAAPASAAPASAAPPRGFGRKGL